MSDDHTEDADERMPLRTKVAAGAVAVVVLLGAGAALARIGTPTISPAQTAPAGHYPFPCAVCHSLSADVPIIGVR